MTPTSNPFSPASLLRTSGILAALAAVPVAASAQPAPPSYAAPSDQSIHGIVSTIDGKYQIHVRDRRGYIDNVALHQGTIINPTGLPLEPGERVTVYGQASGNAFLANEIDVPVAAAPYGFGYDYGYPYAGFGYPFGYGYPYGGFGLGFGFGRFGGGYGGFHGGFRGGFR